MFFFVLLLAVAAAAGAVPDRDLLEFVILHNNDMHGRFEETSANSGTCKKDCVGGFARTAHRIRDYRREAADGARPVLYLNAGDTYVGTSWFTVHKENITAEFLNALAPDAMSLGNHEFDYGVGSLANFLREVTFPVVAANLDFSEEPSLVNVTKSVVLQVGGQKVGIVGHLTPDTQLMSSPGRVRFLDVVESVRNETEVLDRAGVKIMIILGHSGYETDKQIAAEVPLADVVVGGHTNTFLWNGPQPDLEKPEDLYPKVIVQKGGKRVPVVQAYAFSKYLGVLNVTFDRNGNLVDFIGQPELLNSSIPQDQDVLDLLEKYRPAIIELNRTVVGKSRVLLDAGKCRMAECNLGNMIADAFVYYVATQYAGTSGWTDTPIGIVNGGGIRTTIDPNIRGGNITRGELMGTLPFSNQLLVTRMNGSDLVQSLEIGARSNGETSRGEFLQVSGLQVIYDYSQPPFHRVVSVKARCGDCEVPIYEDVIPDKVYQLVTITFLAQGGDAHTKIKNAIDAYNVVQDEGDVDVVAWYLQRQSPVYPEEQGRISFVKKAVSAAQSSGNRRLLGPCTLVLVVVNQLYNLFEVR